MEKKQKQVARRKNSNATAENSECEDENTTHAELTAQIPEEIADEESEQTTSELEEAPAEEQEEVAIIPTLEQLLAKEKELSSKVCELEGQHKELVAERKALISNLEKCQNALRELQRLLHAQEENVTRNYEAYVECAAKMEMLNAEKKQYTEQLEAIRQQIEDRKKINIFVYEEAAFEVENIPVEPIENNEVAAQSLRLFELPEAEVLTGKEIKNVAKLLLVVQMIECNGYKAELVFDSAKVQKFWETVIA